MRTAQREPYGSIIGGCGKIQVGGRRSARRDAYDSGRRGNITPNIGETHHVGRPREIFCYHIEIEILLSFVPPPSSSKCHSVLSTPSRSRLRESVCVVAATHPRRSQTDDNPSQIRAAAAFAGLKIDLPAQYTHFEDNKKPEFLSKFPHGKIPAWDGADGFKVFETTAVARYSESLFRIPSLSKTIGEEDEKIITNSYPCLNTSCRDFNQILTRFINLARTSY